MGYSHIMWVHEDALRNRSEDEKRQAFLHTELGKAVQKIVTDPTKPKFGDFSGIGSHVCRCDAVSSDDDALFIWSGNRLVPLNKAHDMELQIAADLLADERRRRSQGT